MEPDIKSRRARPDPNHPFAAEADLVYFSDSQSGIRRKRSRGGFRYLDPNGKPLHDPASLERIHRLAIPPAWTDVWICPREDGHLQATGYDARHRKQYRYHRRWREVRDRAKYEHTIAFAEALPRIRDQVEADLALPGLPHQKVIAAVVKLLEATLIRVGNERYTRENNSFGLTTLRDRHVKVDGTNLRFHFRGKSGKEHNASLRDRRLARIVKQCQELSGQELFQYVDECGAHQSLSSADVNAYLKQAGGADFTAKDYRTWAGTVLMAMALEEYESFASPSEAKRNLSQAVEAVARSLGNTPTICRQCYIHPDIVEDYLEGMLVQTLKQRAERELEGNLAGLALQEAAVLALLRQRLQRRLESGKAALQSRQKGAVA
jgi:DNA topoisomerase-1